MCLSCESDGYFVIFFFFLLYIIWALYVYAVCVYTWSWIAFLILPEFTLDHFSVEMHQYHFLTEGAEYECMHFRAHWYRELYKAVLSFKQHSSACLSRTEVGKSLDWWGHKGF